MYILKITTFKKEKYDWIRSHASKLSIFLNVIVQHPKVWMGTCTVVLTFHGRSKYRILFLL